jgi:hypothetical protein
MNNKLKINANFRIKAFNAMHKSLDVIETMEPVLHVSEAFMHPLESLLENSMHYTAEIALLLIVVILIIQIIKRA